MSTPEYYQPAPTLTAQNAQLGVNAESWSKIDVCPACEARSIKDKFATIRHIQYSRCRVCGFAFSNPVPTDEFLNAFYNSAFYSNYRRLEYDHIEREHYFSISMYTDMPRLASWLGEDKSLTVLDYGCGTGTFLAFLRNKCGFQNVEGLEISSAGRAIAKRKYGLPLVSSKHDLQHDSYDYVLLFEVIEHLPYPDRCFKEIVDLVKPGGCILITTPGVDNLLGLAMPRFCPHFTAPSHISMFTEKSMGLFLSRFGMKIERIEIDKSDFHLLQTVGISLSYDLDFASPRNNEDTNDLLYTPNAFGRLLGFKAQKNPPKMSVFGGVLRGLDRVISRYVWKRFRGAPRNEHLYVLARKSGNGGGDFSNDLNVNEAQGGSY